jgi:hypothetical protein
MTGVEDLETWMKKCFEELALELSDLSEKGRPKTVDSLNES